MSISEIVGTGGGVLFIIFTLIQISPMKIDPWSSIAKLIGNAINKDIKDALDEKDAIAARIRIIIFNDELLSDIKHSKDYFDQILFDIDTYENYCHKHPDFKNSTIIFAAENIKNCYKKCLEKHSFL